MSTNPRNRSTQAMPPVPTKELEALLTRLRLPAIRDRLDGLLEEAPITRPTGGPVFVSTEDQKRVSLDTAAGAAASLRVV